VVKRRLAMICLRRQDYNDQQRFKKRLPKRSGKRFAMRVVKVKESQKAGILLGRSNLNLRPKFRNTNFQILLPSDKITVHPCQNKWLTTVRPRP